MDASADDHNVRIYDHLLEEYMMVSPSRLLLLLSVHRTLHVDHELERDAHPSASVGVVEDRALTTCRPRLIRSWVGPFTHDSIPFPP